MPRIDFCSLSSRLRTTVFINPSPLLLRAYSGLEQHEAVRNLGMGTVTSLKVSIVEEKIGKQLERRLYAAVVFPARYDSVFRCYGVV
jgi:hypothetical protein